MRSNLQMQEDKTREIILQVIPDNKNSVKRPTNLNISKMQTMDLPKFSQNFRAGIFHRRIGRSADFKQFREIQIFDMMKKNSSFDDSKIAFINQQSRFSKFTSQQINILVKDLSFDKNKLTLAKSFFFKMC